MRCASPVLAVGLAVLACVRPGLAAEIRLSGYRFDPVDGVPEFAPGLAMAPASPPGLHLIQHAGPIADGWREALATAGAEVLDYVPEHAYLVWLEPEAAATARRLPGTRALVALAPGLKLTPDARRLVGAAGDVRVLAGLRAGAGLPARLERLAALGAELESLEPFSGQALARLRLAGERLAELARDPEVVSISRWDPSTLEGELAKRVIDGSSGDGPAVAGPGYAAFLAARGIDGSGVTVAVIDNGVDVADPSGHLTGRVVSVLRGATEGSNGHGHHVAGIVGGDCQHAPDGNGYRPGSGVAPAVGLLNIPRVRTGYLGSDQEQVRDAVTTPSSNGVAARIAACSWNAGVGGDYTAVERLWDGFVRDADDLRPGNQELFISFSAGNAGPSRGTLTRPHAAKNVVTSGSSQSYRPEFGHDDINVIFSGVGASSRGPAEDGRVKPDLVAPGTYVAAANSGTTPNDCGPGLDAEHIYCTGTSMAQPHVAGAAALFSQWWQDRHGGVPPSPALVKAALIGGARDLPPSALGPPFSTTAVPNPDEGWGRVELATSIAPDQPTVHLDQRDVIALFSSGESRWHWFAVADPRRPLRATLVWSDAPAAVGASPALVNDLDLWLSHGTTNWLGNAFREGESDPTLTAPDRLNNVEMVRLPRPPDGLFRATVAASALPGDGIPGNADPTDQDYALVLSNAEVASEDGRARLLGAALGCNAVAEILVYDSGVVGPLAVSIASSTEPAGESVVLLDTSGWGFFTGSIVLEPGVPAGDGRLQVRDGDTVTLTYVDADDGQGGINVLKTATLAVDCRPPVISAVRIVRLTDHAATIAWDTDEPATSSAELMLGGAATAAAAAFVSTHQLTLAGLDECGRYRFRVRSVDAAGNVASDDAGGSGHAFSTWGREHLFAADFERDGGGFSHWGPLEEWQWGAPLLGPVAAFSGDRLWGTDLDGRYAKLGRAAPNGDFILVSPPVDLAGHAEPWLRIRHWFDIASDGATDDGAWVEVWDGTRWVFVTPEGGYGGTVDANAPLPPDATGAAWAGRSGGWIQSEFSLAPFAGRVVQIKLHLFEEDNFLAGSAGWYIDDFEVFSLASCERGRLRFVRPAVACGGELEVELRDSGANLDPAVTDQVTVELRSDGEPGGEPLVLAETGANRSLFRGRMPADATPPLPDGRLSIAAGGEVVAVYLDADGGSGVPALASARVAADCRPPAIGAVAVRAATDRSAVVSWETDEPATSEVEWGTGPGLGSRLEDRSLRVRHELLVTGLEPCTRYPFRVASSDLAGNRALEDNAGRHHAFDTATGDGVALWDDFERDRGWTLDGEWERGEPRGPEFVTGSTMEPNAPLSGQAVLGIDLSGRGARPGSYEPGVALERALSPRIDASRLDRVELRFARWLGVARQVSSTSPEDRAALDVSTDGGSNWSNLWTNPLTNDVNDRLWLPQSFDLSALGAARKPDLRLRFTLSSDAVTEFMGWQIDDLWVGDPTRPEWAACGSALALEAVTVDDSGGNGNGVADPGETVVLRLRLRNDGRATARVVAASARSGRSDLASFVTADAVFPDLAPGAAADALAPHPQLAVHPGARCGDRVPLTLAASSQDSAATLALALPIGVAVERAVVLASAPGALAIPDADATGVASTIEVAESEPLRALEVTVAIGHGDSGDLAVVLTAPDGTTVTLHQFSGAGAPWSTATFPTGRAPDGPGSFADLLGRPLPGPWTLRAIDARRNTTGTLESWTLRTVGADPASAVTGAVVSPLRLVKQGSDIEASWGAAPGAVWHALARSLEPEGWNSVRVATVTGLGHRESGGAVAPGTFYYRVTGVDACGRSGP